MTFPWQHKTLSLQKVKSEFSFFQEVLLAPVFHSVGMSDSGHHTTEGQESPLDSFAENKAFFIFVRKRSGNEYIVILTS